MSPLYNEVLKDNINLQVLDLDKIAIENEAIQIISKELAYRHCLLPFKIEGDKLYVAMKNTNNINALNDVKFISEKTIVPFKTKESDILKKLKTFYDKQLVEKTLDDLEKEKKVNYYEDALDAAETNKVENSPVVTLSNTIINQAIHIKATDIHIEPFKNIVLVRFRIDGILNETMRVPKDIDSSIVTRIKIIANMDIAEKRVPQDGKIHWDFENKNYDLRVSSMPTIHGEKLVIRILYKSEKNMDLKYLGFYTNKQHGIENILLNSHGIILLTGPTGSGKSTTLYGMLNELNKSDKNITTIEDPVEYTIFGINQINTNPKAGLTFASGLRSILRQDPNVIMIGEIRDEETAQIAVRAAITGHLVISTLHTNDAPSAVARLIDMKVPNYLIADGLVGVLSQRLIRKICNNCKEAYEPLEKEKSFLNIKSNEILYRGRGCPKCNGSGYHGRTVVYELMNINNNIKKIIYSKGSIEELRAEAINNGMKTIKDGAVELVKSGISTYEEVFRISYLSS